MKLCVFLAAILEELVASGRLAGSLTGGRHDKAMYIPDVYVKAQNDWVDNFYRQNGYLGKYIVAMQFTVYSSQILCATTHHGLRGSASPVLTATGFVNGRWQFSTPHRINTP